MRTKLIVDSGSTKTDWCFMTDKQQTLITTSGINAATESDKQIEEVVRGELLQALAQQNVDLSAFEDDGEEAEIHYYGAGCVGKNSQRIATILSETFGEEAQIEVDSDLVGAAIALLGRNEGIACILGTGSNSCLFDGNKIVKQTPPLGYILGDEGSGAVLGRNFLNALFKKKLPNNVAETFAKECRMTLPEVIQKVYRDALPNRFLASMSTFIARHLNIPEIEALVVGNFQNFIENNIKPYNRADLAINAIGSIAVVYEEQLRKAATLCGMSIGKIERSPISGLVNFYTFQ